MKKGGFAESKWFGDKAFYHKVMVILIPMIIQQGITNFVNLLDNVMVGQLGTECISGVAVANQLIFVFNIMIFGVLAGASIFGAQYFGKGDMEGFHATVRYRIYMGILLAIAGWIIFQTCGELLFELYLGGSEEAAAIAYAKQYIAVICWQMIPFALVQGIGGALKDCGQTRIPMQASVLAIFTNLVLNYLLIYGKFGFPEMGIRGAALATVIARYMEFAFLILQILRNPDRLPFMRGIFSCFGVPGRVLCNMLITGAPLFMNESLWSVGLTVINSCYATRGLTAVAATNINQTVWNLFGVICLAMGNAVGIIAGQHLGANQFEEAKDAVRKTLVLSILVNIVVGLMIIAVSPVIPLMYQTETEVRQLASRLLVVCGIMMPVNAYCNVCYFTLRSGGKTVITFFFDCGFVWIASLPAAWGLCHFTDWNVLTIYFLVQMLEFVKVFIGTLLVKSGIWVQNILPDEKSA